MKSRNWVVILEASSLWPKVGVDVTLLLSFLAFKYEKDLNRKLNFSLQINFWIYFCINSRSDSWEFRNPCWTGLYQLLAQMSEL